MHSETSTHISLCHADGQKIAKKLSRGISKETNRARQFVDEYNAILQAEGCFTPVPVSEALSLSSKFWYDEGMQKGCKKVPLSIQKEIIDAYLRTKCTNEEIKLVEQEMRNVIHYLHRKIETITNQNNTYQKCDEDMFNKGAIFLLHKLLWEVELSEAKAVACFSRMEDQMVCHGMEDQMVCHGMEDQIMCHGMEDQMVCHTVEDWTVCQEVMDGMYYEYA